MKATAAAILCFIVSSVWANALHHYGSYDPTVTVTVTSNVTPTCNCPAESIVTTTISKEPSWICPTNTTITTTKPAICHCPLETIVTSTVKGYFNCSGSAWPPGSWTPTGTGAPITGGTSIQSSSSSTPSTSPAPMSNITSSTISPPVSNMTSSTSTPPISNVTSSTIPPVSNGTSTVPSTSASPTCSLAVLPGRFFIHDSSSGYLNVDMTTKHAYGVDSIDYATAFHVTPGGDASNQLAFYATPWDTDREAEYRAFVESSGGPLRFFRASVAPGETTGYDKVTATFSTYFCELVLDAFLNHDLGYAGNCRGALSLGHSPPDNGCVAAKLSVIPALL